jgi:hypothetical protein
MSNELESLRMALLAEYERDGRVKSRAWLAKYPQHAIEILDYVMALDGSRRIAEVTPNNWHDEGNVAMTALRTACASIQSARVSEDQSLGEQLARVRSTQAVTPQRAPFRRAAVYAWVVGCLHEQRKQVTRLATQKTIYFLEAALDLNLFEDRFQAQPLGPYDSRSRYVDAEPIAKKRSWIVCEGTLLRAGGNVAEAGRYAKGYLRSPALAAKLLSRLGALSDAELETWATLHAVAHRLKTAGTESVTYQLVCSALDHDATWRSKLKKSNFTAPLMKDTLERLRALRLID